MRITCQFYARCIKLYNRQAGYKFFVRGNIAFLQNIAIYRVSQEERSIFWEVIVSVILSKKVYMYMCPILNGFRDRAISPYSTALYTVQTSNTPCPHTHHWFRSYDFRLQFLAFVVFKYSSTDSTLLKSKSKLYYDRRSVGQSVLE
jgi:hypothetical protein